MVLHASAKAGQSRQAFHMESSKGSGAWQLEEVRRSVGDHFLVDVLHVRSDCMTRCRGDYLANAGDYLANAGVS